MSLSDLTDEHHCIGFIETSSIAKGIEAVDVMMKMADVELLLTTIIPRGKYLIMIG
jgi:microcompartment protein CcmL/EutN